MSWSAESGDSDSELEEEMEAKALQLQAEEDADVLDLARIQRDSQGNNFDQKENQNIKEDCKKRN